jgi:hypothetical protein
MMSVDGLGALFDEPRLRKRRLPAAESHTRRMAVTLAGRRSAVYGNSVGKAPAVRGPSVGPAAPTAPASPTSVTAR